MLCFQGLEEPQPVLGVYKELQIPKARELFPVRVKHIRTPNEVCELIRDGLYGQNLYINIFLNFGRYDVIPLST